MNDERYITAHDLFHNVVEELEWIDAEVVNIFKGSKADRIVAKHPFYDRDSLVMLGNHVTIDAGTGCVHTAPGHGEDDFYIAREYGIEALSPVRSEEHTSELQSRGHLVCRLLLE